MLRLVVPPGLGTDDEVTIGRSDVGHDVRDAREEQLLASIGRRDHKDVVGARLDHVADGSDHLACFGPRFDADHLVEVVLVLGQWRKIGAGS